MIRVVFVLIIAFTACNNEKKAETNEVNFEFEAFSKSFKSSEAPYQLADSVLVKGKTTDTLNSTVISKFLPDSISTTLFGKSKVKYAPLAMLQSKTGESYFVVKASTNNRRVALLLVFNKQDQYAAAIPFLIPDDDATTTQFSSIDNSFTISRNIYKKLPEDVIAEGKDVYAFSAETGKFNLIVTDLLDGASELINPIDTFPRKHKLAGDYGKDRNIVSVRDGRNPNELSFFVHFEKDKGECIGELKGIALLTSATTAIYRQGGDPCVLQLRFSTNSVTLVEEEGCGSHRGVQCLFEGTFQRKKQSSPSTKKAGTAKT